MPQIIGIFLRYLFVALTLTFSYKSGFKITKIAFYVFAFFAKILVINVFKKYIIRYKIKFHIEVT
jgi:hypothetical protein